MNVLLPSLLIFAAALLYSSVGHGGASAYLAVMALYGTAPEAMKPAALSLNVLVASIGTVRFYRAGCLRWGVFLPLAAGSIPFAFLGGLVALPGTVYRSIVGAVLLFAAARLLWTARGPAAEVAGRIPKGPAVLCGAGIGFLSGATGVGGGIFLSPLLLFLGWADMRTTAGVSAAFILVNSIAGLSGHMMSVGDLPGGLAWWALAAVSGGWIGSHFGSRRLRETTLRRLLGAVLLVAGAKLILT